jgi:hypothetical protein
MRLEMNRRGHRWVPIGADVECLWCGDPFVAFNSAPFCCTDHRRLWNDRRKPRRPVVLSSPEQQEAVMQIIRARLGLQQEVEQQERRTA